MQGRELPQQAEDDLKFDSRPAYQFCKTMDAVLLNYLACAYKYERFNDDMDNVRNHLQHLKRDLKTGRRLVEKYEETRPGPSQPGLIKGRSETAAKKSRLAETKLKQIQSEYETEQKELRNEEDLLKNIISMTEENEDYKELKYELATIERLSNEKTELENRRQKIQEKMENKLFSFLTSHEEEKNELSSIDSQQKKIEMQLRRYRNLLARRKNKFPYIPKRKEELQHVQEKIKNNDETYPKKIQAAKADFDMAQAKLFMETVEVARAEINFYALVTTEIALALLRVYVRFMQVNKAIEETYQTMMASNKVYNFNPGDIYKDPLVRIKSLHKIVAKNTMQINTMANLVRCHDLNDSDIAELYEAYSGFTEYLRNKFMDSDGAMDFQTIFSLCLNDIQKKDTAFAKPATVSTLFMQAKENIRKESDAQSAEMKRPAIK